MAYIRLIHWHSGEAQIKARPLSDLGHEVDASVPRPPQFFKDLQKNPPDAVLIDLTRLPAQGRDLAVAIRRAKATRHIQLIFLDGEPAKVARIKQVLPDAVYTSWEAALSDLPQLLKQSCKNPIIPSSIFQSYAGVALVKKLGITPYSRVALIQAPESFVQTLLDLPEGVTFVADTSESDLILWFVRSKEDLQQAVVHVASLKNRTPLWIIWKKQTALKQQQVRQAGLAAGLVDYKICAVDATWSGLKFIERK
ncbi:DUF3052 family protein [candidate division KSB1 bacterium]|nr:DUF3052 family protein [candidate division KSB1 bacterium]